MASHDRLQLQFHPVPNLVARTKINKAKNHQCTNYNSVVTVTNSVEQIGMLSKRACGCLHKDLAGVPNLDPEGVRRQNGLHDNGTFSMTTAGFGPQALT
jgi:hypothetical protein